MSESDERASLLRAGFEHVHVEIAWYDGPRAGVADIGGGPHYFASVDGYANPGADEEEYFTWPADGPAVDLEVEQWGVFCVWNARFEAGEATVDSHPGHGGVHERYDELEALLGPHREVPPHARRRVPRWRPFERPGSRYHPDGPGYAARWSPARGDRDRR